MGVCFDSCKRVLWEYVSTLIGRWNGETIIMGDFNDVRSIDERRGSCYNPSSARAFDHFISSSGLVDVKLEGYAFTWFNLEGFDAMVEQTWRSFSHSDVNKMIRFKKNLQDLKAIFRCWVKDKRRQRSGEKNSIKNKLSDIDKDLDRGAVSDTHLFRRLELQRKLRDINQMEAKDSFHKSKVKWAIEGDENSKFFHGIINKKRSQLAIRGVFVNGLWCTDPGKVKEAFFNHFEARFMKHVAHRFMLNFPFNKRLSEVQAADLERSVSRDEIRLVVWNCGENKSPGLDGYTFEFFRKYRNFVGPDFGEAVEYFFETGLFSKGCNSSFVALIPKVVDAKFVNDFRPISLIGSVYKVVTKVLANWMALVIADLVSDTQSAFVANRKILDRPLILNEILHWCKRKKKQDMFFKVDFAKAYDSVRWDYLLDVLEALGLVILGFSFQCGLKQGDPLSPYLFILIMESLHMSFSRVVDEGEWSDAYLKGIINILQCFFLTSGLRINIHKSQVLGVGISRSIMMQATSSIGCGVTHKQFCYLGVMVKTLSIGGRLTLLKSVLGASPLYNMSIFKVPKGVLKSMKAVRSNFFNGADSKVKKITWASWDKLLTSKKNGGLELDKEVLVVDKMKVVVTHSFRRHVRAGSEHQQMVELNSLMESVSLSQSHDRWIYDLAGDGEFHVKEVRNSLDNLFLLYHFEPTRWVKYIPIKINVFAWRAHREYLPTRANLNRRGIILDSSTCPLCQSSEEDIHHVLFRCDLTQIMSFSDWQSSMSFSDWQSWFSSICLPTKVKNMLEGHFRGKLG
ncbi:RNA-directed DNA polymerase, eukaryota [Tanacetum coccineum]